jgi:hypothetical protein
VRENKTELPMRGGKNPESTKNAFLGFLHRKTRKIVLNTLVQSD